MKQKMKPIRGLMITVILLASSSLLTGCNVEKARAIQGAAVQFRAESLAAIDALDDMHRQELTLPARSPAEIRREFISNILGSARDADAELVELAIDPYQPPAYPAWDEFILDLKGQYTNFAAIFDKIDSGALVSKEEVKQSVEYGQKLTVQMVLFADALSKNPPVLYRQRNVIVKKLRDQQRQYRKLQAQVRDEYGTVEAAPGSLRDRLRDIENQVGELLGTWQQVREQEQKLLDTTLAQCLKAAVLGKELGQLMAQYDQLDLSRINVLVPRILNVAATITGRDYGVLRVRATGLLADIRRDPLWSQVTRDLVDRVNSAISERSQPASSLPINLSP
jgi:hypothetical protein